MAAAARSRTHTANATVRKKKKESFRKSGWNCETGSKSKAVHNDAKKLVSYQSYYISRILTELHREMLYNYVTLS